jgi:hypothetical protein
MNALQQLSSHGWPALEQGRRNRQAAMLFLDFRQIAIAKRARLKNKRRADAGGRQAAASMICLPVSV